MTWYLDKVIICKNSGMSSLALIINILMDTGIPACLTLLSNHKKKIVFDGSKETRMNLI